MLPNIQDNNGSGGDCDYDKETFPPAKYYLVSQIWILGITKSTVFVNFTDRITRMETVICNYSWMQQGTDPHPLIICNFP